MLECALWLASFCTPLTAAQSAALVADGITTRMFVERGRVERALLRPIIGKRPTWQRMIPAGALEVAGTVWIGRKMQRSNNRVLRKVWWVPQLVLTSLHTREAIMNYQGN